MNRRQMLASMAGAALVAAAPRRQRNVISILTDDHRYDALGFMKAQPWLETPQIDRLAMEGAHFNNAFVSASRKSRTS